MLGEIERDIIESNLNDFKEMEQRKLGLDGVKLDIDYDDLHEEGSADPKTNTIKIYLAKFLEKTLDYALQNGHQSIRHELRHFWQRKHKKEHVEWWDAHGEYYDELIGDGKEYDYCTIEIDAEAYAKGSTGQEYQLDRTKDELETTMKCYYENKKNYEQMMSYRRAKAIDDYLKNRNNKDDMADVQ